MRPAVFGPKTAAAMLSFSSKYALLSLSIVVAVIANCSRLATARTSTNLQVRKIVLQLLSEDKVYTDLLSENVKLVEANVPLSVRHVLPADLSGVDPLVTLHRLTRLSVGKGDSYSGDALTLSKTIIGTAVKCMSLKRVVVHLLLALKMMELETDQKQHVDRLLVLAHAIPTQLDMLSTFGAEWYEDLLRLYDAVGVVPSEQTERTVQDGYKDRLAEQLQTLNAAVQSSCLESNASEYYADVGLTAADTREYPVVIEDGLKVADNLPLPVIIELLKENENALMDQRVVVPQFKSMGLNTWRTVLDAPPLTTNAKVFKRKVRSGYYEEVTAILDESWKTPPASMIHSQSAQPVTKDVDLV